MVEVPPAAPQPEPTTDEPGNASVEVPSGSGWTTFHGNNARTGTNGAPGIRAPRVLWKAKTGIFSWLNSPLVVGKTVVIAPSSGTAHNKPDPNDGVFALDYATGKRIWFAHFDQDANGAAASQSRVFATSDDGNLYALDIRTGKEVWKKPGKGKMYTHPLLLGDRVIVGDAGGYVRAFAADDGKELWQLQLTGAVRGGASADAQNIYVASQGGEVAALTSAGKTVWRAIVKRPAWNNKGPDEAIEVYSPPVVDKDVIYVTFARDTYYTDKPAVFALDKKTGKTKWRAKGPGEWGNVRSTPALVAGTLVWAEPYSGDVVGLTATTGRMAWRETVGDCYFPAWASAAVAGDLAYVPRLDGTLQAMRASSGKLEWKMYLGESAKAGVVPATPPPAKQNCGWDVQGGNAIHAPAALGEDGRLFVGTDEGVLFAIGN